MIAGQLEIQLLANMARLQTDLDKAKRTVSGAVDTMNRALGTIGIGVSVAGLASMVKGVIDAGDKLNDLRKISGLTVEQLGGLEKQAKLNGSSLDQVARAVGVMSKNMYAGSDAFKALGIQTLAADGGLRDVNAVLLDVADRFSRMKDGAEKSAIANQIFGKSGRDLIPMLSEGRAAMEAATASYAKNSGMTQKLAEDSDRFNDILTMLGGRVTAVKNSFVGELLPTLINIGNAMLTTTEETNKFSFAAQVVVPVLKFLALAGYTVVDTFRGMGREIGARAAQLTALANMDFSGAKFIGSALAEDNAKARAEFDKFFKTIMDGESVLQESNSEQKKMLDLQAQLPASIDKTTNSAKLYNVELYKLKQAQLEVQGAREIEYQKLKQHEAILKRAESVTQSVATKQEIYNKTLEELNRLRPYLSVDAYTRALQKAEKELNDVTINTRTATDEVSQMWIQAGRNIQNALGNLVFDFFNGGLDNMVSNVKNAVMRIASEFIGLRISQSLGLAGMFTASGAAAAGTGAASGSMSALNIASLGSSAMSMFRGGFGVPGFIGNMGSSLPGAAGSFFTGMAGKGATQLAAESGAMALWGTSGASTGIAASMGSAFAAAAGPLMAAFVATQLFKSFAGDKRLGGGFGNFMNKIGNIPILGDFIAAVPLINALFGRGPLKQRETTLSGSIGLNGFESGMLQTHFMAKGGLFRSNKNDYVRIDAMTGNVWTDNQKQLGEFAKGLSKAAKEIFGLFNDTAKQTSDVLHQIGGDLGLSTEALKDFHHEINLVSEKGKNLTEEQIGQEIEKLTSAMAHKLVPQIDELTKRGETALQAVVRLGSEFTTLVNTVTLVLGKSTTDARSFVQGASFEDRSRFVEDAGGVEALGQMTQFFADNFLTAAERLAPKQELLAEELTKLGLATDITKEQYKDLVQSVGQVGGVSEKTFLSLLKLAPAFIEVRNAAESIAVTDYDTATNNLRSVWAAEEARIKGMISQFESVIDSLKSFRQSLLLGNLSPLDPYQKYLAAQNQFNDVSRRAQLGDVNAMGQLQSVGQAFLEASQGYYASSPQYAEDFQRVMAAVETTESVAERQVNILERQLAQQRKMVEELIDLGEELQSLKDAIAAAIAARDALLAAQQPTGTPNTNVVTISPDVINAPFQGPLQYYDQARAETIRSYVSANSGNLMGIYTAATANGVSSGELAAATGWSAQSINKWVSINNLEQFDVGANYIPRDMIARVHKGEEIKPKAYVDSERKERAQTNALLAELVRVSSNSNSKLEKLNNRMAAVETAQRLKGAA